MSYLLFWYTLGHSHYTEIYQSKLVVGIPLLQRFLPIPLPVQRQKLYLVLLNRLRKELDSRSKESGQEDLIVAQWIYR